MKKILLTGSTGLVGKNFLSHVRSKEYNILAPVHAELDLTKPSDISEYLREKNPDVIVHCAARVGGIKSNMNNLFEYLYDNTVIGFNLVHAARSAGVESFINLGSSCMYPKHAKNPLIEEDLMAGKLEETNEGYAISKISVAMLCLYASKQLGLKYKTLIPCNLYGLWDKFDPEKSHMLPAAIRKIHFASLSGKEVEIWGSGSAKREFMFAEDLADFIYFSLDNFDKIPDIMNVGTGIDHTILEYHEMVSDVIGTKVKFLTNQSMPDGMKQKVLDISSQKKLGWSPKTSLHEGIEKTYKHFLETYHE